MPRKTGTGVLRAPDVGIDIGSANTVVASADRGVLFDEPTCVAFDSRDRRAIAFGYEAAAAAGKVGDRLIFVRPVSRARPVDADTLHSLLSHVVRALDAKGVRYRIASIAVPMTISPSERSTIERIATEVGVAEVHFVAGVVAASRAAQSACDPEKPAAIVDIGAEVTSWGLVEGGAVKDGATWPIGTRDFSDDLTRLVQRRYGIRLARSQAEAVITSVGCRGWRDSGLEARVGGKSLFSKTPVTHMVSAEEVADAIGGRIGDLSVRLKRAFDGLPESTLRGLVDGGVGLCGGGALTPGLAEALHARTGLPIVVATLPLHVNAIGAARALVCLK
jgi:rod shape-determining protein MreB